ncbi:N-acetylmuramoyl-L-alanine amidase [Sutcliffiella halmapala]|uniref:N-acetylmuramoyl-L-alanine amidase n=1 Tax=Sutcliffiella halmapala TaxID=79882 RepID=UPI0009958FC6|nr:N-acetylmuramoyl-L-alanine amidase [Sutcliffiella halmapala]
MRRNIFIIIGVSVVLLVGCVSPKNTLTNKEVIVEQKPLDETYDNFIPTIEATAWFLPEKNTRLRTGAITHIMLHFTNNVLRTPEDPYNLEAVYALFEEYEVSAHYMIGRDGEIFHLVPEGRVAFHAGKGNQLNYPEYQHSLNDFSIGIELLAIGTKEEMLPTVPEDIYDVVDPSHIGYTDAQYQSLNILLDDILHRHTTILRDREHIMGHNEYAPVRKTDPGSLFNWSKIGF